MSNKVCGNPTLSAFRGRSAYVKCEKRPKPPPMPSYEPTATTSLPKFTTSTVSECCNVKTVTAAVTGPAVAIPKPDRNCKASAVSSAAASASKMAASRMPIPAKVVKPVKPTHDDADDDETVAVKIDMSMAEFEALYSELLQELLDDACEDDDDNE